MSLVLGRYLFLEPICRGHAVTLVGEYVSFNTVGLNSTRLQSSLNSQHSQLLCQDSRKILRWPEIICRSPRLIEHMAFPNINFVHVDVKKSIFVAHSSSLRSTADIPTLLSHLVRTSSRFKRATHCMHACRITSPQSSDTSTFTIVRRQDDGGEKGSGDLLDDILERAECKDVIVVVWRWYGGVKLGGERWRVIGRVAREALKDGGFFVDKPNTLKGRKRK